MRKKQVLLGRLFVKEGSSLAWSLKSGFLGVAGPRPLVPSYSGLCSSSFSIPNPVLHGFLQSAVGMFS